MKENEKKVSPEFKDQPELGSLFLSVVRNTLSPVGRDFRLPPVRNRVKIGKQKLAFHIALSETAFTKN